VFDQSKCDSQCPEKNNCMRNLIEDKYCFNPVNIHFNNHLCNSKNNYNFKIHSTCEMPLKGGEGDELS